jgi:hypothetical protein
MHHSAADDNAGEAAIWGFATLVKVGWVVTRHAA